MSSGQSKLSSGSHVFSALLHRGGLSLHHFTQTFANMEVHRLTHSVKPFHFKKYSTLPFTTRRRMILSTANSWTTAVSSVFLCLAVCFFLILPPMTSTRTAVHEHIIKHDTCATITRVFFCFVFFARIMRLWYRGALRQRSMHLFQLLHLMFRHFLLFFQSKITHAYQCVYVHNYSSEENHVPTTERKHDGRNKVHVRCRCLLNLRGRTQSRGAARLSGACRRVLYVHAHRAVDAVLAPKRRSPR